MAAPLGNSNAAKGKRMSERLKKRLEERELWDKIADTLLEKAVDGDMMAIKEVFDRIDGKPKQSIDVDANLTVKEIRDLTDAELNNIAQGSSD